MTADTTLQVGKIAGAFGIRGWVKIYSETDPVENILNYSPWLVRLNGQVREMKVLNGRAQGKGVVAQLEGINDRNQAELLNHAEISILRDQLPESGDDGVYWDDLEGLAVENTAGVALGTISHLFETAAHDVLVVADGDTERMIPFVDEYVKDVDLEAGKVIVDWQADW